MPRRIAGLTALAAMVVAGVAALGLATPLPVAALTDVEHRPIVFPVGGPVSYSNDFGDCRGVNCSRRHEGNDLMGKKLQPLVAARDATVAWLRLDSTGNSGNMLALRDAAGWQYWYIHINNDSPGTDDGANPRRWNLAPGIKPGVKVKAGQLVAYLGDSGNAEGTAPHLHFEIHRPDGRPINPYASLRLSQGYRVGDRCRFDTNPARRSTTASASGYWTLGRDGGIFTFGAARFHGSMGGKHLNQPVVGMAPTGTGRGYWEVASDGGIFAFGDAQFRGSMGGTHLNKPITAMTSTRTGNGYFLTATDGGIFAFGDAKFRGSTGNRAINRPIIGTATTPTGNGYWLLAADGGLFAFGDAAFHGSLPAQGVRATAAGMASTATGRGYWIATTDGHVYAFGDAARHGSPAATGFCAIPTSTRIRQTTTGRGYWVQSADGTTWAFGDARDYGDLTDLGVRPNQPIIDLAVLPGRR